MRHLQEFVGLHGNVFVCVCVCMKSECIAMMCVHAFVDVQACIFVSKCVGACV